MNKEHELKTLDIYFDAVQAGTKTFEVRKNDRAFQTGDILVLQRIYKGPAGGIFYDTKVQPIRKKITYILQGGQFGIESSYCVLGLGDEFLCS